MEEAGERRTETCDEGYEAREVVLDEFAHRAGLCCTGASPATRRARYVSLVLTGVTTLELCVCAISSAVL